MDRRLETLLCMPGISGFEDPVREYLTKQIDGWGAIAVDAIGNLTLTLGKGNPSLLIVAHMDELGLLISGITDDGYLHFRKVGTIDDGLLPGHPVHIHTPQGVKPGAIGMRPPHLGGNQAPDADKLFIDIGASSRDEVQQLGFDLLQPVTFVKEPRTLNRHRINCRSLDDRAGCYIVLRAAEHARSAPPRGTVTFAWSVQEEVGLRGAQALAASASYDFVIPVDAFATSDAPEHPRHMAYAPLGKGPVLRMVDHGAIASRRFAEQLKESAKRHHIPLQVGVTGGETDGKPLQAAGGHMVPLTLPMRYLHSLAEMADMRDIDNAIMLLRVVIERLPELGRTL
jgi:putative aminopeptidase FrvX